MGRSGVGKTQLLKNFAIQDMRANQPLAFLDAHGDVVDELLDYIPSYRTNDVVLIRPYDDRDFPVGLNFLEATETTDKDLTAFSLVSIFRHLWSSSWGPRADDSFYNAARALLDYPDSTMIDVLRIFTNDGFRKKVVERIEDPAIKYFWTHTFPRFNDRFNMQVSSPILNKAGPLVSSPMLRNIVAQPKSTIDLAEVMERRSILLVSLQKGLIGEARSRILGSFIIAKLYLAALQRQHLPEDKRRDFYLYIDEAATYFGDAGNAGSSNDLLQNLLSESRKYRLCITLACQFANQFSSATTDAILGNCGNLLIFRIGTADTKTLEPEFSPYIKAEHLAGQKNYNLAYKRPVDGAIPASTTMMPPIELAGNEADRETVIRISRERYGTPRKQVEDMIHKSFA